MTKNVEQEIYQAGSDSPAVKEHEQARQEAEGQPAGGSPSWYSSSYTEGMYLVHEIHLLLPMTYLDLPGNGGGANPRGAASLLFGIIFAENCIKMTKKKD